MSVRFHQYEAVSAQTAEREERFVWLRVHAVAVAGFVCDGGGQRALGVAAELCAPRQWGSREEGRAVSPAPRGRPQPPPAPSFLAVPPSRHAEQAEPLVRGLWGHLRFEPQCLNSIRKMRIYFLKVHIFF